MPSSPNTNRRIVPLEALRGLAALTVVFGHFVMGFIPQHHGYIAGAIEGQNLMETPLFFLFNGLGWITFFFVLSGYVLTHRFFLADSSEGLVASVLKRWPRLFPLALISTLYVWFMFQVGGLYYFQATEIARSEWMMQFGFARGGNPALADFGDAFMQGFFYTFFRGDAYLNTSLWTMQIEFLGSLVVFGMVPIIRGQRLPVALALFVLAFVTAYYANLYMCPFVLGCFLSYWHAHCARAGIERSCSRTVTLAGVGVALLAMGFLEPAKGFYGFLATESQTHAATLRILMHSAAATLLIHLVMRNSGLYRLLDNAIGRFLGRCSFPLYVMHVPILFSLTAYLFFVLYPVYGYAYAVALSFVATLPVLFLVSWLLAGVDGWWCRRINRLTGRFISAGKDPSRGAAEQGSVSDR